MDSSLRNSEPALDRVPDLALDLPADLSPLAWVQEELRRSLEAVHKTLRRLVRDSGDNRLSAFGGDTQPSLPLQQAAAQLHQVSGVLSLVGLPAGATVLRAAEAAVARLAEHPLEVEPSTVETIERANFALLAFVARLLAGNKPSTLTLYPSYRDLQQLNGAARVHPADLWQYDWAWRAIPLQEGVPPRSPDTVRAPFESALLRHMREPAAQHAAQLSQLCAGLAADRPAGQTRTLWQLAAAVFEGQALKLLAPDAYQKRLGSKLLSELRALSPGQPGDAGRERLAQDLLFFCAQCRIVPGVGPRLAAVHEAYHLTEDMAGDYEDASLGRIDPAWVAQGRRRVIAAKDGWSSAAEGDQHRLAALDEQFAALADSLTRLFPAGDVLAQTLQRAVVTTLRSGQAPAPALAMEIATSLLYVEAALEDAAFDQPEQAPRVRRLASRVEAVSHGEPAEPLEDWMEELYRRVSDRQTLGSVVHELRASLSEVERQCDEYFRSPAQRELLIPVPGQLQAMRGVLSVLGLDQAAQATVRMRDEVDSLASTEIDFERAAARGVFERLANNLGALGFLIDMLSVQPQLAKRMFEFDEATGRLDAVMGRREGAVELPDFEASGFHVDLGPEASEDPAFELPHDATQPLPRSLSDFELPDLSLPDLDLSQPTLAPVAAPITAAVAPPSSGPSVADDPEMREIFLEEAEEVLGNARAAVVALQDQPDDPGQLTVIRRAFHTLKGSARMVGLNEFGEGAWACEQLYNARLGEAQPVMDAPLRAFTTEALDHLDHWRAQIAGTAPGHSEPEALRRSADALRLQGEFLPLSAPLQPPAGGVVDLPLEPDAAADDFPGTLLEGMELAAPSTLGAGAHPDADAPRESAPVLAPDFVFDMDASPDASAAHERAEPAERLELSDLPELAAFSVAEPIEMPAPLDIELDDTHAPTELLTALQAEFPAAPAADMPLSLDVYLDLGEAQSEEPPTLVLPVPTRLSLVPAQEPEATAALDAAQAAAAADPDEGFKLIGSLRISIALFNIFLNEADELSRRLSIGLAEWAAEMQHPVPASCEAQAHALAGNAATVGYDDLSALARELEHTLGRAQRAVRYEEHDAELFVRASDDIRRLLHQFAAGFLKPHDPELVQRLHAYQPQEDLGLESAEDALPAAAVVELPAEPVDATAQGRADLSAGLSADLSALAVTDAALEPAVDPAAETALAFAAAAELEPEPGQPDAIEPDLYPIFEEEGRELLQQLHGALRDWLAHPAELARADACMRALHTFKGGARLAGAMRLGEQAHQLESHIEAVLRAGKAEVGAVQALQQGGDELEHAFEQLGLSLMSVATAAPAAAGAAVPGVAEVADLALAAAPVPDAPLEVSLPEVSLLEESPDANAPAETAPLAAAAITAVPESAREIDWSRFADAQEVEPANDNLAIGQAQVRVRGSLLERMATQAGEVSIRRARMESELAQMKSSLLDLDDNLDRLRAQLRELDLQAEAQMHTQQELAQQGGREFDPLEFDRYTRFQELTRMLTESVGDVATLQRALSRNVQAGEDELAAQSRLTRELQDDLLRTRLVEFDSIGERMHRVVRQAARDTGKPVKLDISGGQTELDRGVLERMSGAFEHLLRNSVSHGIEAPEQRGAAKKDATGTLRIDVSQQGNEVLLNFADDGAGLNLDRIRQRGLELGLIAPDAVPDEAQLKRLIFAPGFSTASQVTELSGRGVGMDVVRAEVGTLGGSIETATMPGEGTRFLLRLPLTTALTQVVLLRSGEQVVAVPAALMDSVQRVPLEAVEAAYASGQLHHGGTELPFYWLGGLLGQTGRGHPQGKHVPIVLVKSAQARLALHVDEVVGNQEVVVKNLGAQLNKVPGLAGISLLASGDVALIYNVVALADWYGIDARARLAAALVPQAEAPVEQTQARAPLVLVVDDSLTVRRVTQRMLERVGLRVALAKDGLDAMEQLAGDELPSVVLSDIEMPRMDGFDLVRNMRADARLASLPVIMITSRIAQKHRDYAEQLGVDHYLGKPYDEELLLGLIQQYTSTVQA